MIIFTSDHLEDEFSVHRLPLAIPPTGAGFEPARVFAALPAELSDFKRRGIRTPDLQIADKM